MKILSKILNIPSAKARIVSDLLKALAILSDTTGAATEYLNNVLENGTSIFLLTCFSCNSVSKMHRVPKMFVTFGLISKAQKVSTSKALTSNKLTDREPSVSDFLLHHQKIYTNINVIKFELLSMENMPL